MSKLAPTATAQAKVSGMRKLEPQAKLPARAVLDRLWPSQQKLLEHALSETLECVFEPDFRCADAEQTLLCPMPEVWAEPASRNPGDSGADLLAPRRHKVLTIDEERQLFLRFNYCRYRVMSIVREHRGKRLGLRAARELLRWQGEALRTRNTIVRLNTSLVMAMARRTKAIGVELGDLVSEGNFALLRCVDKFDCGRGFKFSTYACRAIMSGFARLRAKAARHRGQFPAPYDSSLERSDYLERRRLDEAEDCVIGLRSILAENSADLSAVERRVISERFSLGRKKTADTKERGPTLEQVGALLGVSKERVRQIQNRALKKLRHVLEESVLMPS